MPLPSPTAPPRTPLRPYALGVAALCVLVATGGCGGGGEGVREGKSVAVREVPVSAPPVRAAGPRGIPGLGPRTRARIPDGSRQALVVTGEARDANRSTAVLYARRGRTADWRAVSGPWPAHNALRGWTDHHRQGDLRSPVGVFGLTDAGGLLPDPGTDFPYDRGPAFRARGTGFEGESLDGSFDYVIAVNYNRRPGTTPLDWTRPLGAGRGGGIWLHVDHGGPTQGCVSLPRARMKELLRTLEPDGKPVVVMGDAAALGR
ncbi:L,D-transpeptidase family protein [Streptomyces sp. NPDC018584]|uniref:L,D-transpeptidase family protein n=1 Tax=unclassified Streptomyces TaxID=2593676 RepID=UPI0037B7D28F